MTLDDLEEQAKAEMLSLLKLMTSHDDIIYSKELNRVVTSGDPQAFMDFGFGSSGDALLGQAGTLLGRVYVKAVEVRRACQIYIIGRDEGLEQAMLWKLAND